jgi:hypothetical protein
VILYKYSNKKYPASVGYFCWRYAAIIFVTMFLASCVHPPKAPTPPAETKPVEKPENIVTVTVQQENIRSVPNGPIVGQVRQGDRVSIIAPKGNWMYCQIGDSLEGYIWAPSLGFPKLSFLNIHTYFPGTDFRLMALDTLARRLGQPFEVEQESPHYQRVLYDNTPQGGHYPFGSREFLHLTFSVTQGLIADAFVDLNAKQIRQSELLRRMGLKDQRPTYTGFQDVLWDDVFRGLGRVALERASGSFTSFSGIRVYKVNPDRWKSKVNLISQSCQIGKKGDVTIHLMVENADSMAYSDMVFDLSFYDQSKSLIYRAHLGPLPDIVVPHGHGEIFADRIIPELSGRSDSNYIMKITSARPLFAVSTP